jgi:thymidylate synthase (FAD)
MKLIKPSFEIWNQPAGLEGVYKQIERVGRVCYKSEDKITEDSAKPFVDRIIKSGHGAMLEHGTVYMFIPIGCDKHDYHVAQKYHNNKYSKVIIRNEHFLLNKNGYYITTNLRVLVENEWMDDLKYICDLTEFHEKRITVHFVCDRGLSHEFVRHRVMSFAQESTRYCNYSKDKFGNELTFIIPCWLDIISEADEIHTDGNEGDFCYPEDIYTSNFLYTLRYAERAYLDLLQQWDKRIPDKRYKSGFRNNPWTPQQARAILPNALKTELVVTGFVSDWNHFFDLRARGTTGAPHPQAKELAEPLMKEFIARKYINN